MAYKAPGAPEVFTMCVSLSQRDQASPHLLVFTLCVPPSGKFWTQTFARLLLLRSLESPLQAHFLRKASLLGPSDPIILLPGLAQWLVVRERGGWWWDEDPALSFIQH